MATPLDISGYTISDLVDVRHTFPAGTVVPAGGAVVVFGGARVLQTPAVKIDQLTALELCDSPVVFGITAQPAFALDRYLARGAVPVLSVLFPLRRSGDSAIWMVRRCIGRSTRGPLPSLEPRRPGPHPLEAPARRAGETALDLLTGGTRRREEGTP